MARKRINIPEKIITAKNPQALVHFLRDHPGSASAIDTALHKVGYAIDYSVCVHLRKRKGET